MWESELLAISSSEDFELIVCLNFGGYYSTASQSGGIVESKAGLSIGSIIKLSG